MKFDRPLILASTSPRRQFLMKEVGFQFSIEKPEGDESFPATMPLEVVPKFLAEKKARIFKQHLQNKIVITSDTVVILGDEIMNKPGNRDEAIQMLSDLSGRTHQVITAVCLLAQEKQDLFDDRTEVTFKKLSRTDITSYVENYQPLDKAGAYGAQECLPAGMNPCSKEEIEFLKSINRIDLIERSISTKPGMEGIERINGSYFTVMGFPIHKVYQHLMQF